MEKPDIVVSTPSRVQAHINAQNLQLQTSLEMLVIDEADLLFSFGFEADLKSLLWYVFIKAAWDTNDLHVLLALLPFVVPYSPENKSSQNWIVERK